MESKKISLCMIARNEASNIGRCLQSVFKFVDEIIVVDTGSTDNTVEIAKKYGAKVIKEEWQHNFSKHRNTSLKNATGDWILFLDCDEELMEDCGHRLREVMEDDFYEAYFIKIVNKLDQGQEMINSSIRLFKNRETYSFSGKIHEQIIPSILKKYDQNRIGNTDIYIIHHGYNSSEVNIKSKIRRNLDILESYPESHKNGFYYYNLGTEYQRLGQKNKALDYFQKALDLTKPSQTYGPVLVKKTITSLMDMRRFRDALQLINYYLQIYSDFQDLWLLAGLCHQNCGRYSLAKESFLNFKKGESKNSLYPTNTKYGGLTVAEHLKNVDALALERNGSDISVCIRGWNEGKNLLRCLKSINEIADEVIYIDTGSDDNSCALAYQFGADIFHYKWDYDYAKIRNYAIKQASGKWILMLDGDEMLSDEDRIKIVDLITQNRSEGFILKIVTYLDESLSSANCTVKGQCRLFKNKNFYYQDICYEKIEPGILASEGRITAADIQINHLHFLAEEQHIVAKSKRKETTIAKMKDKPIKKAYIQNKLAYEKGQYQKVVKHSKHIYKNKENISRSTLATTVYYYCQALINLDESRKALEFLNKFCNQFPDYTDLFYLNGLAHYLQDEPTKAEALFDHCLKLGEAPWEKYQIDPGTGHFKALCSLAAVRSGNGDLNNSLELLLRALEIPGAYAQVIEEITLLFLKSNSDYKLDKFLEENNLDDPGTLGIICQVLSRSGMFTECLGYLQKIYQKIRAGEKREEINILTNTMDQILNEYSHNLLKTLPKQVKLAKLIK